MVKSVAHLLIVLNLAETVLAVHSGRKTFNVKDFGAKGDKSHDDTDAIRKAFDALKNEKSSELQFPKGNYKFGPIQFSDLNDARISFENGAELYMGDEKMWKHYGVDGHTPWFKGDDCDDLEITGGVFHGDRDSWQKLEHGDHQPNVFSLGGMKNLKMHDFSILTAPASHISVHNSDGVSINHIQMDVKEVLTHNTEGITLGTVKNAHITHVDMVNGDDCLKVHGVSSDILFEKCSCTYGHGLSIGGDESDNRVQNVKYYDIHMYGTSNAARLKITPAAKGFVKNITWEKIRAENVKSVMHINSAKEGGSKDDSNNFEIGDLYYTDIKATYPGGEVGPGSSSPPQVGWFNCDSKHACKKLHLKDITIESDDFGGGWLCEGGNVKAEVKNVSPKWSCDSESALAMV